jgi:hypothetical protein
MRYCLIVILSLTVLILQAQSGSSAFNAKFKLKNGIYTSNHEILNNDPKYPDFVLEVNEFTAFGKAIYSFYSESSGRQAYTDSLYAVVKNGILTIYFRNEFRRLIVTGTISLFFIDNTTSYANNYSHTENKLFFFNLLSGEIKKMNCHNLEPVFMQDDFVYSEYLKSSKLNREKILYSTVVKYNQHNPVFIPTD